MSNYNTTTASQHPSSFLRLGCLDEAIADLERLEEAGLCPQPRLHLLLNKLVNIVASNHQ